MVPVGFVMIQRLLAFFFNVAKIKIKFPIRE